MKHFFFLLSLGVIIINIAKKINVFGVKISEFYIHRKIVFINYCSRKFDYWCDERSNNFIIIFLKVNFVFTNQEFDYFHFFILLTFIRFSSFNIHLQFL